MGSEKSNIFEKMLDITSELTAVAKNLLVGEGRNQYKAVGEADVLAAVRPLEKKYRVYSYPFEREIIDSQLMIKEKEWRGNVTKTQQQFIRIKTVYRFVNIDNPEEYIDITSYGDGVDSQDKAPGKAITYSDKYALLKAYKIITGDDPDQFKSEDGKFSEYQQPVQQYQQPEQRSYPDQVQAENVKPTRVQLDSLYELAKSKGFGKTSVWKSARVQNENQMTMKHYMSIFERLQKLPDVKQSNLDL